MAPLPQNNTPRIFFDYLTGLAATSVVHTVQMRINPATADAGVAQAQFLALLNALGAGSFRQGWKVTGVRYQAGGSNFSTPLTIESALAAFVGTNTSAYNARFEAVEETIQGRSQTSGRRVDISLYRATGDATANFRTALAAGVLTALQTGVGAGVWRTIDNSAPVFYSYLNSNYNSYWEGRIRSV